jgi:uncharacterized protein YbaP (TraB family)
MELTMTKSQELKRHLWAQMRGNREGVARMAALPAAALAKLEAWQIPVYVAAAAWARSEVARVKAEEAAAEAADAHAAAEAANDNLEEAAAAQAKPKRSRKKKTA